MLKQDPKVTLIKLKWLKKNQVTQAIMSKFISNTKSVYRDFKGSSVTVNKTPTKNEVLEKHLGKRVNVNLLKELEKHIGKT